MKMKNKKTSANLCLGRGGGLAVAEVKPSA